MKSRDLMAVAVGMGATAAVLWLFIAGIHIGVAMGWLQ